jgi:hypothetical protein
MADRVNEVPKFRGAIALTLQCRRQNHPSGGVGVLAAVLADARHISFDVAGLKGPLSNADEQLDQLISTRTNLPEPSLPTEPAGVRRSGDDRPSLGGVDLALVV